MILQTSLADVSNNSHPLEECIMPNQSVGMRPRTIQVLRNHPFMLTGLASFFIFAPLVLLDLQPDSALFHGLVILWQTLGVGPHAAANLLARYAPNIPGWLDVALILILGLFPYAAADVALRRYRNRRVRSRVGR
jgi:hypothetical protein